MVYALVTNGGVVDVAAVEFPVHPDFTWVDASAAPGVAVGWAYASGAFSAPPVAAPTLAQQAAAAMNAGLMITLSGTVTLAATVFPTDPTTQRKIANVAAAIGAIGAFPGGATTFPMKDASGAWHGFDLAQWKIVAGAIAAYAAALQLIIDGNPLGATQLPNGSVALTV